MDKLLIPTPSNGVPFNWDDLDFANGDGVYDGGLIEAIEGQLKQYGDNFIVSGCEVSGSSVSAGWVMLDGELIKVDAHTTTDDYYVKAISYNSDGDKQTQLGATVQIYQENRATSTASSGNLKNDNRLFGSYTDIGDADYTKVKINEFIAIEATTADKDLTLGTGLYDGEECTVEMEVSGEGGSVNVIGSTTIYTLDGVESDVIVTKRFKYIDDEWVVLDSIPDADTSRAGIQRNVTQVENDSGNVSTANVTPIRNSTTLRYKSKTLTNAENYTVATGVGKIIIPSSVTSGTIKMPSVANAIDGHEIWLLVLGNSGVTVYLNDGTTSIISSGNMYINSFYRIIFNGTTWWVLERIDAPGTV